MALKMCWRHASRSVHTVISSHLLGKRSRHVDTTPFRSVISCGVGAAVRRTRPVFGHGRVDGEHPARRQTRRTGFPHTVGLRGHDAGQHVRRLLQLHKLLELLEQGDVRLCNDLAKTSHPATQPAERGNREVEHASQHRPCVRGACASAARTSGSMAHDASAHCMPRSRTRWTSLDLAVSCVTVAWRAAGYANKRGPEARGWRSFPRDRVRHGGAGLPGRPTRSRGAASRPRRS